MLELGRTQDEAPLMSYAPIQTEPAGDVLPTELVELMDRLRTQPAEVREELEPLVADAVEQARFRGRIMTVARDALERLKLDLELARFDLDATRREREDLRRMLGSREEWEGN
jgi:nitric oxide reductase activation protein